MSIQEFSLEVTPILPEGLSRLKELTADLRYSWNIPTRTLFESLDKELWMLVGHNPQLFLQNIEQAKLNEAANNPSFLNAYHQVLSRYDAYYQAKERREGGIQLADDDLIAYFCAEYGFHESLPVYSGGLGILAGDHCKTASDMRLPFVGVGLFYHQGYFSQQIDKEGNQIVSRHVNDPRHLPINPIVDDTGAPILIEIKIGETPVWVKAWQVQVGHIQLYLLDTNVSHNNANDRAITDQLYGGDQHTRIKQEIVLGIGGVRMLRRLGISPTVWHINEGHAAFLILERLRELKVAGHAIETALEAVAANTVFTTHTPVPAGHDHFPRELMMTYLGHFAQHELGLSPEAFLELGCLPQDGTDFNMTTLAVKGARHLNGVSRIHGGVSAEICAKFWPAIAPVENPMRYVTNGVHISSILTRDWSELFNDKLGIEWHRCLCDTQIWQTTIESIPDQQFWQIKQVVKSRMLVIIRRTLAVQYAQHQISETHLERILKFIDPNNPNILTIGFARRFATYKRATLLLKDLERLRSILTDSSRPVVFIFAGKAHPADIPGQNLLKALYHLSAEPDFLGKLLVVQGYDLGLSRRLVSGVDVWLNNPIYPLEASGTSGMKAAINAAINLSILDGWWAEGYEGDNGWAIKPSTHSNEELRDQEEARSLYEVLQDEVIPLYYDQGKYGYSPGWIKKAKRSMASILPRFNTVRMLNDYIKGFYLPASQRGKRLRDNNYAPAQTLANWKAQIINYWNGVRIRQLDIPPTQQLNYGEAVTLQVALYLNQLSASDVTVELILSRKIYHPEFLGSRQPAFPADSIQTYRFVAERPLPETDEYLYTVTLQPEWCGGLKYQIRAYPHHELLSHPQEMGMMLWV
jgi:starch phosphorylase